MLEIKGTLSYIFFFNDTATTEIYTLSLHDALPIWVLWLYGEVVTKSLARRALRLLPTTRVLNGYSISETHKDRKSTRLNSSHANISYAVFCLKKKKTLQYILFHELTPYHSEALHYL